MWREGLGKFNKSPHRVSIPLPSVCMLAALTKCPSEYGRRDPPRLPRGALYPQKLALTLPTSGGSSVCIFRSRTKAK
jgi:hypothetical protein